MLSNLRTVCGQTSVSLLSCVFPGSLTVIERSILLFTLQGRVATITLQSGNSAFLFFPVLAHSSIVLCQECYFLMIPLVVLFLSGLKCIRCVSLCQEV